MPTITKISDQKRRPNRRNVYLDGKFAFGCNINVVARFRLREGLQLSTEKVKAIEQGEVKQECFDAAMRYLQLRLHSRAELHKKLTRKEYGEGVITSVIEDLTRLGYVNDERFAKTKALSAAQHRQHGRRRAFMEILKTGVKGDIAGRAVEDVYEVTDSLAIARTLAMKQAPRLRRLDPVTAKRRLIGMLQRRGFDYDTIRPVVEEVLGGIDEPRDD